MNKKKLIILLTTILLSLSVVTVFAAFMFRSVINGEAQAGDIKIESKLFLDYSLTDEELAQSDKPLLEKLKERALVPQEIDASINNSITCYATERKGFNDEENLIYLNQLGLKFSFTTSIDAYVRIHFEDAWISKKTYNNGHTTNSYITKDKLEGKSPFDISNEFWVYDEATNCVYLKNVVSKTESPIIYSFDINPDYWYQQKNPSHQFREQILVQVSYVVDIAQANRAEQKWNVNLDEILRRQA